MPSLSELPSNVTRQKFIGALTRLGFVINTKGGKGSHIKATFPKSGKMIIIPDNFRKDILYHCVNEIEEQSRIKWEDIKREL